MIRLARVIAATDLAAPARHAAERAALVARDAGAMLRLVHVISDPVVSRLRRLVEEARDDAKAQGKGFLGQWGAQLGASGRYHEVYWQMPPEAALAETPGNFAVDRATIEKVKFERGGIDDDNHSQPDYVIIKTSVGKFRMRVGGSLSEVRGAFEDAGIC